MTCWSSRPRLAACPELVVARASNPRAASIVADPTSHGLGMTNVPSRCSWRNVVRASALIAASSPSIAEADSGYPPSTVVPAIAGTTVDYTQGGYW